MLVIGAGPSVSFCIQGTFFFAHTVVVTCCQIPCVSVDEEPGRCGAGGNLHLLLDIGAQSLGGGGGGGGEQERELAANWCCKHLKHD